LFLLGTALTPCSYLQLATRRIAEVSTSSKIVVEKSTVPCRTAE
jgi:UDPglucose 6-dehydrogenase